MPKLLIFVPCEKIIIDDQANVSLIVLLANLEVQTAKDEIPKNAVTPKEWAIFSEWEFLPGERGKAFRQVIQILWPDGSEFKRHEIDFQAQDKRLHHVRLTILGFPVGQIGEIKLKMWLEEDSRQIGEINSYSITVSQAKGS